jgi:uncharacterized protein (DUF983 family)
MLLFGENKSVGTLAEITGIHSLDNAHLRGGITMKCPKCKGKMYSEKFYDFVRSFDAWTCTCCGEMIDSTIAANRASSRSLMLG